VSSTEVFVRFSDFEFILFQFETDLFPPGNFFSFGFKKFLSFQILCISNEKTSTIILSSIIFLDGQYAPV